MALTKSGAQRRKLQRDIAAHAVPDHNRTLQTQMVTQPAQIVRKADRAIVLQRRIACTMSPEINGYRARERSEVLLLKPEVAAVAPEPMYEKDRRSVSASRLVIGKGDPVSNDFHRV